MKILVVGASGKTGRLLVEQLLDRGECVKIIVRSTDKLSESVLQHPNLTVTEASILQLSDAELAEQVEDCDALASCLGHNLTFAGVFGSPHRLVASATRRLCNAVLASNKASQPTRFVLMNTSGVINPDQKEKVSFAHMCVIWLLRLLLPPHTDNEKAAKYLRKQIGQDDNAIEWVAVRPDDLIDEDQVTTYTSHPSPTRSAIFRAGKTSRINVGHFMAELICNDEMWNQWKGEMPVIYNA